MKKCIFLSIVHVLVDARKMLVDAHKMQKCKVWVKGFPTHNFACILDKNSPKYVQFNSRAIFAFLQKSKISKRKHAKFMKKHENLWIFKFAYFSEFSSNLHDKLCVWKRLTYILHFCSLWASATAVLFFSFSRSPRIFYFYFRLWRLGDPSPDLPSCSLLQAPQKQSV